MSDKVTTVAIAICAACGERPEHQGDARGNSFRWQDYLPIAEKAIAAMDSAKDAEIAELREAMARQAAAVRNLHSAEKVIASGLLREADKLHKQSNPEAIASERDANAALTDALEAAERERDEARATLAEWEALGTAVIYGGVPARDTPTLWPNPWRQTIAMVAWAHHDIAGQRDEARECVRRLHEALLAVAQAHAWRSFGECRSFDHFGSSPILSAEDADNAARRALAATPEHLRNG